MDKKGDVAMTVTSPEGACLVYNDAPSCDVNGLHAWPGDWTGFERYGRGPLVGRMVDGPTAGRLEAR